MKEMGVRSIFVPAGTGELGFTKVDSGAFVAARRISKTKVSLYSLIGDFQMSQIKYK